MQVVDELKQALGEKGVLTGAAVAERSASFWDPGPLQARALLRPVSTAEVSTALRICHQAGQTVVTHGGKTGVVLGERAGHDDVVLSLERMNAIENIDDVGRTASVQAGCILETLQNTVAEKGLYFPLDLGARGSCTVGGNVATNAGGINVIRYGMMRELVLGLEAVLADGTVLSSMNTMLKNNAGYDLKQLFIGSEGTLGVVTRVVVKLVEPPLSANTAFVACDSFENVIALLKHMDRSLGGMLSSYEVMWGGYVREVTGPGWHKAPMSRDYAYYVVMEAEGADPEADKERFEQVLFSATEAGMIVDAVLPQSKAERDRLWAIREDFEAILQYKPNYVYDISLPIRHMAAYVREVEASVRAAWPRGRFYAIGHIGDGNLHFFVAPGVTDQDLQRASDSLVYEPLHRLGGSVSAEHGIGLMKRDYLGLCRTPEEIALMRTIKQTLDPGNLLNPGKVIN